jgi:hypothetical protein
MSPTWLLVFEFFPSLKLKKKKESKGKHFCDSHVLSVVLLNIKYASNNFPQIISTNTEILLSIQMQSAYKCCSLLRSDTIEICRWDARTMSDNIFYILSTFVILQYYFTLKKLRTTPQKCSGILNLTDL